MTLDVYADLFDSDHGDLADRLDAAVRLRRGRSTTPQAGAPEPFADYMRTRTASSGPAKAFCGSPQASDQA